MPRSISRGLLVLSVLLYLVALPLPACTATVGVSGYPSSEAPQAGWQCLLLGIFVPYIWVANPLLWAVWFYYRRRYGLLLASLALVAGVIFLVIGNPRPLVGGGVWVASLLAGFVAALVARGEAPPVLPT